LTAGRLIWYPSTVVREWVHSFTDSCGETLRAVGEPPRRAHVGGHVPPRPGIP
jgi:hypothetical protein